MSMLKSLFAFLVLLVTGAQQAYADSSALDTVTNLYRDYAWVAIGLNGVNLSDQPKQTLDKYFDNSLANLILKDRECRERTHEICHLDFDIIFASQDPAAADMEILPEKNAKEMIVRFRYPSTNKHIELKYILTHTKSGWRIDDIEYGKGQPTLRQQLK